MKSRVAGWLLLCAVICTLMAAPAMAQYPGEQHFGDYDDGHVWRDAQWWHGNNPEWMYSNHPEWAQPYGGWLRADYGAHPGWFTSNYWREHPRDWANPDRAFWNRENGRFNNYLN